MCYPSDSSLRLSKYLSSFSAFVGKGFLVGIHCCIISGSLSIFEGTGSQPCRDAFLLKMLEFTHFCISYLPDFFLHVLLLPSPPLLSEHHYYLRIHNIFLSYPGWHSDVTAMDTVYKHEPNSIAGVVIAPYALVRSWASLC